MTRPPAPVHYLRPNHAEWSPPTIISLDTESYVLPDQPEETHGLRCWVARVRDRKAKKSTKLRAETGRGQSAGELVKWLHTATRNRTAVWLFAHNLSFDLATTRLPIHLVAAGWSVSDASIGGKAPWVRMAKGERRLTLVDSWSWFPTGLKDVGERLGIPKPKLPAQDDDLAVWLARCEADVDILEAAVLQLLDWWDRNRLGRFNLTGAATGWNAFRHTQSGMRVTIDPDPGAVAQDRLSNHGGRRGTWAVGEHRAGPFYELDLVAAYPTVAAHLPLPCARTRVFDNLPVDTDLVGGDRWGITATVRVRTDVARWPVKVGRHTWYPVGEFWADLCGPEIAEARRLGCLVEIGPGAVHRLDYAMQPWAQWVLAVQDGRHPDSPPMARLVAKAWGRSVIGKWAARAFDKQEMGPAPTWDWGYEQGWDHTAGCRGNIVDLGGKRFWVSESADPENAYPAVQGWVAAEVRARLSRVIEAIGPGALLQCDTDGLIVAGRVIGTRAAGGHLVAPPGLGARARLTWVLDQVQAATDPLVLRVKAEHAHVTVLGPQHLMLPGQRRFSGIPADAQEGPDGRFMVHQWPKLQWQMAHGSAAGYVRPLRPATIKGPYPTGWVLRDGRVAPLEARIRPDGSNALVPWHLSRLHRSGAVLGPRQHTALEGLRA